MGTRADFYIGRGPDAEWLGSVGFDGYEWAEPGNCLAAVSTADEMRAGVKIIAQRRRDFTDPSEGWPWPWDDSRTTDYAYVLHDGKVTAYCFGREVVHRSGDEEDNTEPGPKVDWFPNMAAVKNVTLGPRSGLIVVST